MNGKAVEPVTKPTLKERALEELRSFRYIASYLFVCFAVLMFYDSTWSIGATAGAFSLGAAAIKAAILGKFILLGHAMGVGETSRLKHLGAAIFGKSVQLAGLLVVLTVAEELIVGKVHGHSFTATLAGYEQHSILQMLAKCLLVLLILLPLVAARELSRALGPGVLRALWSGKAPD